MDTELKVDLDKKTATLVLDYITITPIDEEQRAFVIKQLSNIKDLIVEIKNNIISVKIEYDFGVHIPEGVWNMRDNLFINGFSDKSLSQYWDQLCKEAVLECVRQIVMDNLRKKADELIKDKNEQNNSVGY